MRPGSPPRCARRRSSRGLVSFAASAFIASTKRLKAVPNSAGVMLSLSAMLERLGAGKSGGAASLVLEVSPAGEQHRHAVLVRGLDHHRVTQRATGLDDRGHSGAGSDLDAIRERKVRVRCHDREARVLPRFADGDLDGDHARQLTWSDADARESLYED